MACDSFWRIRKILSHTPPALVVAMASGALAEIGGRLKGYINAWLSHRAYSITNLITEGTCNRLNDLQAPVWKRFFE